MAKPLDLMMVLMAIRLVQPGRLADIVEGVSRLTPMDTIYAELKKTVSERINTLRDEGYICLYRGQRYLLTAKGRNVLEDTGIKLKIDARRLFLLKETRKASVALRSNTRDGSL